MSKVQLLPSFIKSQLEAGIDKETIRLENYPTLNVNQWKQALKAMNLSSVRAKKVTFEIIDETTPVNYIRPQEVLDTVEETTTRPMYSMS